VHVGVSDASRMEEESGDRGNVVGVWEQIQELEEE